MNVTEFMVTFSEQLEKKVSKMNPPIYKLRTDHDDFGSLIDPLPLQREVVRALAEGFNHKQALFLIGQPGSGKTLMGTWLSRHMNAKRTLVQCPPHLIEQWAKEITDAYPSMRIKTIPDPAMRSAGMTDLAYLQKLHRSGDFDYLIVSREAVKFGLPVRRELHKSSCAGGKVKYRVICPRCSVDIEEKAIAKYIMKPRCQACGEPLYTYHRDGNARPMLANYMRKYMRGFFSLGLFDEAHELKAEDSLQGEAFGKLAGITKSLCLTGTLMGGLATDVNSILFRTNPQDMVEFGFGHGSTNAFVKEYGTQERITRNSMDLSGKDKKKVTIKTKPGMSPRFVGDLLLDKAVFVRLSDFAVHLPLMTEIPIVCAMHPALQTGYDKLFGGMRTDRNGKKKKQFRVRSSVAHHLLSWPDLHRDVRLTAVRPDGEVFVYMEVPGVDLPLGATEKEQRLVEICQEAKRNGKKILIYTEHTRKHDIQPRISELLMEHGMKTAILRSGKGTRGRLQWIREIAGSIDALILHPGLISLGSNLPEFPYIAFMDTGISTFRLRQAAMRSMRLSQKEPEIKVFYLYTRDTAQQDLLSIMAKKVEVSLMVEGEMQEGGLIAMSEEGDSILTELAKILNGELKTENPLEVFSRVNKLNNIGKNPQKAPVTKDSHVIVPALPAQLVDPVPAQVTEMNLVSEFPGIVTAKEFNSRGQAYLPF